MRPALSLEIYGTAEGLFLAGSPLDAGQALLADRAYCGGHDADSLDQHGT